jgi:murein DD-endopeptidase MepM/ murein hydrolase activator NlpD
MLKPPRTTRRYTMLILDEEGRIRRVRFTGRAVKTAAALAGVFVVATIALLFAHVSSQFTIRRLQLETGERAWPESAGEAAEGAGETGPLDPESLAQAASRRATMLAIDRYFVSPCPRRLTRPERWPLRGWATSDFGRRLSPLSGEPEMHAAVDLAAPIGSEVRAPAAGEVLFAGERPGYGLVVTLEHGLGYTTFFGHLDRALVTAGQEVQAGEAIGRSGNTGQTSGPHLHYETRRFGLPVDPRNFLPDFAPAASAAPMTPPPAATPEASPPPPSAPKPS